MVSLLHRTSILRRWKWLKTCRESFVGFRIFSGLQLDRRKWISVKRKLRALEMQRACGMISEERMAQLAASVIGHLPHADSM